MSDWVYGIHAVTALVRREPRAIEVLCVAGARQSKRLAELERLARDQGIAVEHLSRVELDARADGRHQGVAARMTQGHTLAAVDEAGLMALVQRTERPLLLILDEITDPHNLGACLRTADAAGVTAVVVPRDGSADLGPVVRKVACGAADTVPFVRVTNLARTLRALRDAGVWLVGTSDGAPGTVYDQDLTGATGIVMGAEGSGMRRLTAEHCDFLVKLPMLGTVSSLNVSVATGICLYEALRQRSGG